jgi:hypothetical protein
MAAFSLERSGHGHGLRLARTTLSPESSIGREEPAVKGDRPLARFIEFDAGAAHGPADLVSNFDPMALGNGERFALNERIKQNPQGFVSLDLRPEGPGDAWNIQGAIKLRSMLQILVFLAHGISAVPEFVVAPDARTGSVASGPAATLAISVTDSAPAARVPVVAYAGRYYAIRDTAWDRAVFAILNILFQTTVGTIQNVGIPITISK